MGRPAKLDANGNPVSAYMKKKRNTPSKINFESEKKENNVNIQGEKNKSLNSEKNIFSNDNEIEVDNVKNVVDETEEPTEESVETEQTEEPVETEQTEEPKDKGIHPYLLGLLTANPIISKISHKKIMFEKEEIEDLNNLFWRAYPNSLNLSPKTELYVTLISVYVSKLNLLKL